MNPATASSPIPATPETQSSVTQVTFTVKTPAGVSEPVTEQQLAQQIRTRRILPWDLVSTGDGEFRPAVERENLAHFFRSLEPADGRHCWKHRTQVSYWICSQCGRGYCETCHPAPEMRGLTLRTCPACEAVLKAADPRWREKPFWERLDEVLVFPLRDMAWVTTAGIGFLMWTGSMIWRGQVLYLIALAYLAHVVVRSAKGDKKMGFGPEPDIAQLAWTGGMALLVTAIVFLPLIIFSVFVVSRGGRPGPLFVLNVLLGLLTFVYYPMALGMSVVWHNTWLAFRPDVVVSYILRIKKDYLILLGVFFVGGAIEWVLEVMAGRVLLVGGLFASPISAYVFVVEAHALGWTFYIKADELGWS